MDNALSITGTLTGREEVRFTPSGIEVFEAVFHHRSEVVEAGHIRRVEFEFPAVSFGELAEKLNKVPLGTELTLKGFMAPRSMKTRRLIVHITEYI